MIDTTERSLRRAILESPFDDAPRLIYADWTEENGYDWMGGFIRWQVLRAGKRISNEGDDRFRSVDHCASLNSFDDKASPWYRLRQYHGI